jgi:hypothetical protein
MEFKMKTKAWKFETYYIDRKTGTAHKVMCIGYWGRGGGRVCNLGNKIRLAEICMEYSK